MVQIWRFFYYSIISEGSDRSDMRLGEVSLLTNQVIRMSKFYKELLEVENNSEDEVHQTIIGQETMLTIYDDGSMKNNKNQNICIAFTVEDMEKEYKNWCKNHRRTYNKTLGYPEYEFL